MAKKSSPAKSNAPKHNPAPPPAARPEETTAKKSFFPWLIGVVLFAIAMLIYSNTFEHRFVLDDHGIIKNNKITKADPSWENTKTIFTTPLRKGDYSDLENSLYRPFTKLLFNLEWSWFNGNDNSFEAAHSFHVVNVLLYAMTCLILFFVLYDAFKKKWVLSFLVTLLFVVHPMHVETVANIKSGDEILSMLGVLLAIRCVQLYLRQHQGLWLIPAILAYLMGSFSKESTVVAVLLIPAFFYFFSDVSLKKNAVISSIFLLCSLFFLFARHQSLSGYPKPAPTSVMDNYLVACDDSLKVDLMRGNNNQPVNDSSVSFAVQSAVNRFPSALTTLGYYVYKFVYPQVLSCDYSYSSLKPLDGETRMYFFLALLLFGGMIYYIIRYRKRKDAISFGFVWFFISISITSNILFLIGTSFGERLFFMPSLGLCISLVGALYLLSKPKTDSEDTPAFKQLLSTPILTGAVVLISILFAARTWARNNDWRSDFLLFSTDIENFPNSTHLLFYMGNHLSGTERKEVLTDELSQLGYNMNQINDSVSKESAKSIDYFNRSLSIYPALPSDGYNQLGKAYFNRGNLDSAYRYYMKAFKEDSTNGIFINNIGTVYYNRGMALLSQGQLPQATSLLMESFPYFKKAHTRDTTESDFMNNIGCVYGTMNNPDSAIYWFEKALAKDSLDLTSLNFLSMTWRNKGDSNRAQYYLLKAEDAKRIKTAQIRQ